MILSDNETKIDMLNNKAIAKTVADIIRDCDDRPISIGIHGDWGAGKSSILPWLRMSLIQHLIKMIKLYVFVLMAGNIKVLKMQK